MDYSKVKKAIVVMWVMAIVGIVIKEVQVRTLNIPIEMTDAQYLALGKVSKTDAYAEAQLVATAAVTGHANQVLASIEKMTTDMHKADVVLMSKEETVTKIVDENMPRQGGFVGKETGDAEFLAIQAKQQEEENIGQLTASGGVFMGPSGKESYYALPMGGVLQTMRGLGYSEEEYPYWVREDGCKMLGPYIMCAANLNLRPFGTILDTSLGEAIVCDTGAFAADNTTQIDIATTWGE